MKSTEGNTKPVAAISELSKESLSPNPSSELVTWLGPLTFAIVTGGQLLNQSRPILVQNACNGDRLKSVEMLARFGSLAGAAEFFLNPLMGRLSDKFGRKPILILSPAICAVLRGAVAMLPSARMIMVERMLSSAVSTGFFSTARAMLSDRYSGRDLVVANGAFSSYAGAGIILGPYLEVAILKMLGARASYGTVMAINVFVVAMMCCVARESLSESKRLPLTLRDCSPLTFVQMLRAGSVNQRLMLIVMLQSFSEPARASAYWDMNMLSLRNNLGWTSSEISTFMTILGTSVVVGGKTVKAQLNMLGMRGHTTVSNLAMALAFLLQGAGRANSFTAKYLSQYFALSLWFLGGRKRDAVEALCTELTLRKCKDMGKGQISSALTNFKSLATIIGPRLSGTAYAYGASQGIQGLPYKLIGLAYVMAELTHLTMTPEQMGIKDGD